MVRDIIKMGHPNLMKPAKLVDKGEFNTDALNAIIADMTETLKASQGVGIAAPQINIQKRILLVGFEDNTRYPSKVPLPITAFINSRYIPLTENMVEDWEGCLSVPGLRGLVPRYTDILHTYQDEQGEHHKARATDFEARIIQHECDHLDGILYPARIRNFRQFGFDDSLAPRDDNIIDHAAELGEEI